MERPRTPVVVATLFVLALVVVGLYDGLSTAFGSGSGPDDSQSRSVQALLDNGSSLMGKRVSVQGEVSQVLSAQALTLGGDNPDASDLLVLKRDLRSSLPEPSDGAIVLVTGTVQRFGPLRATRQYGGTFDPQLFQSFQGKPALSATRIERVR